MNDKKLIPVLEGVDLLLCEQRHLRTAVLHFLLLHEYRLPGTDCAAGEIVAAVYLVHRGHEFYVPLSLTLRLFFDFLAKRARIPQTASEIVARFRADRFYSHHGSNVEGGKRLTRRIAQSAVRVYVDRTRRALAQSFRNANLRLDPSKVLVSEETVMNEVGYRLRGSFEWFHTDHPGRQLGWVK
jgi:hypothetical protein